jgi:hypothetical protein
MYNDYSGLTVNNCIFWKNDAMGLLGPEIAAVNSSTVTIRYSDVQGGIAGLYWDETSTIDTTVGNRTSDPLFVDADLRLMPDSPCIDTGDPCYFNPNYPTDLDGRPRIADGDCNDTVIVDIGAYEFTSAYYGDFDGDCDVEFMDYSILANCYLTDELLVDIAPTPAGDGIVDANELAILCNNWLFGK